MKKQVIFVHGGDIVHSYKEYISFLKEYKIDKKKLNRKKWHAFLDKNLGKNYEVIKPQMPNAFNARYLEWKIWFGKFIPLTQNNVTLIGGSLGGTFLIKYLLEEGFPKKIKGLFFVASPFGDRKKYYFADFHFNPKRLSRLNSKCKNIFFYQSKDDPIVPYSDFESFKKYIPNANFIELKNRGHFFQEKFPELIRDIKALK